MLKDLKAVSLREIGLSVRYDFPVAYIKYEMYHPSFFAEMELDQLNLRKAVRGALTESGLKVELVQAVNGAPEGPPALVRPPVG